MAWGRIPLQQGEESVTGGSGWRWEGSKVRGRLRIRPGLQADMGFSVGHLLLRMDWKSRVEQGKEPAADTLCAIGSL